MRDGTAPLVPIIVGPTGVGKTAVAVALADAWNILVVSADSRQVYRRLDIGTAKPDPVICKRVPHVGLSVVEPGERFSAGQFARRARQWILGAGADRQVLVVGGTGFYIKALTDGLFEQPEIDEGRLERLRQWARSFDDVEAWAARLDPRARAVGRRRATRVVEVALLTGYPLSWWHRQSSGQRIIRPWFVRLRLPRDVLYSRIRERAEDMLRRGWVEEVEELLASGIDPSARGLDAVGYRDIIRYLAGQLTRDELPEVVAQHTRRYAKRQETWLNHQLGSHPILAIDATEPVECMAERIIEAWNTRSV